ncbi:hypothetical protein V1638_05760 [Pseudarthrobacter sp. J64]|uniref:hypothetical protein n=1 Tax=Pseudarthrobacter sp. J64 TaxID=3116485 RepID=UPI002E7FF7D1|nr:hypothetical protein [Pseudarthrobacter sp. J64]MEE2568902.1 hypothetical protein [Pseudarthrobacter sp. J64]
MQRPKRRADAAREAALSGQAHLLASWAELSLQAGWRDAGDWNIPEVHLALAAGTPTGLTLEDAARDLGAARFYQGVGVAEVMADWNSFLQASGQGIKLASLQAVVEGWVDASERAESLTCIDPSTGLRTASHVEELLRAIYSVPSTPELYSTAVLDFPKGISATWTEPGWPTAARIAHELNGLVSAGSAAACFVAPQMLILFQTRPDTALLLRHFYGRCLDMLDGASVDFAMAPLPLKPVSVAQILCN